jgi:hypothetical protein
MYNQEFGLPGLEYLSSMPSESTEPILHIFGEKVRIMIHRILSRGVGRDGLIRV